MFIRDNQALFEKMGVGGMGSDELIRHGWARIGILSDFAFVDSSRITQKMIEVTQEMVREKSYVTKVTVNESPRTWDLPVQEFLAIDKPSEIRRGPVMARRIASEYSGRAWLLSPKGEVIPSPPSHDIFIMDNPDLFPKPDVGRMDSVELVRQGWARIGILANFLYIDCARLTTKMIDVTQEIMRSQSFLKSISITEGSKHWSLTPQEFFVIDKPTDVRRMYARIGRRKSALPKSRDFLRGLPLGEMSWPLQRAFDLLHLTAKKDEISANQVVSALKANEQLLQEKLGRTSVELIRDLNEFVQYDATPVRYEKAAR